MAIVIKYGGNAMTDNRERREVAAAIRQAAHEGLGPIIVHGGGPFIARELEAAGLSHRFIRGLRVTTPEALVVVERTLTMLGKELAQEIGGALDVNPSSGQEPTALPAYRLLVCQRLSHHRECAQLR